MFELTEEQKSILGSNENIKIEAYAGTGKTSTMYHYIKTRPENSKILYIAFNKSVQEDAEKKFTDIDHLFLHVRTTHSMAYEHIVRKHGYKVGFFNPEDVTKILKIKDYVKCTHIVKLMEYWCACAEIKVQDVDYKSTLNSEAALNFVTEHYDEIVLGARKILAKMKNNEIPITHDFYLKLWQLSNPVLRYDYIIFDEGQDASETMLDVFNKQKGIKIIVGDTHQQIYSWRNAINSLEKVNFKQFKLTQSFRFNQDIANLGARTIKWKKDILNNDTVSDIKIIGAGGGKSIGVKAIIARSNSTLLSEAIDQVIINKSCKAPYFEGGFANYAVGNITTLTKDIIKIFNGKYDKVVTPKIKGIANKKSLAKFIDETSDNSLAQIYSMVNKYGDDLIPYIKVLKSMIVEKKEDGDLIFTTVHKSKGMEYDLVVLLNDFPTKVKLKKMIVGINPNFLENTLKKINEEINLLYVAITRTKNEVYMNPIINNDLK